MTSPIDAGLFLRALNVADKQLLDVYKLTPDGSPEKSMIGAILSQLFDAISHAEALELEQRRAERRKYQP